MRVHFVVGGLVLVGVGCPGAEESMPGDATGTSSTSATSVGPSSVDGTSDDAEDSSVGSLDGSSSTSSAAADESSGTATSTAPSETTAAAPTCGDGDADDGEACDDANDVDGDGCSAACEVEPGWSCADTPSTCVTTCGDGIAAGAEPCDDGDLDPFDGCTADCSVVDGWSCGGAPNVCTVDPVEQVALGGFGGCVRTSASEVACFGEASQGAVGVGMVDDPVLLPQLTLDDAFAIAAGEQLHCALRGAGEVWCWGDNADRAMGPTVASPDDDQLLPIAIGDAPMATAIAAGDDHVCVIDQGGDVWCWGDNDNLQLGRGGVDTTDGPEPTAVVLPGDLAAIDLGLGEGHSCAVLDDGSVACWGDDDNGQLGDGVPGADRSTAALVPGLAGIVDIEAGEDTTCARDGVGAVWCWGDNIVGQLGIGNTFDAPSPLPVGLPAPALAIAVGDRFACALLDDGQLVCWGDGADFQLGNGSLLPVSSPTAVVDAPDEELVAIEAGARGACVRTAAGGRWCWGYSGEGQLGFAPQATVELASTAFSAAPVAVALDPPELDGVLCGVLDDGSVECTGNGTLTNANPPNPGGYFTPIAHHLVVPTTLPLLANVQAIAMGDGFACAVTDIYLSCWGDNSQRQLGQGGSSTTDSLIPSLVAGLALVDELAVGAQHACARAAGTVYCWGDNAHLQTGESASQSDQSAPVVVPNLVDPVELALGERHGCARLASGEVRCWGDDSSGQLGDDDGDLADALAPVAVTGLPAEVDEIGAGARFTCARASGEVYCWGAGDFGQLAQGDTLGSDTALQVPGIANAVQLAVGYTHACARDDDGALWCWGESQYGQLGDGGAPITGQTQVLTPTSFLVASDVTDVVAGQSITCVETAQGWGCVGRRATGQLGDGSTVAPVFPTATRFGP
jgi:cysteine-rich repeat protein